MTNKAKTLKGSDLFVNSSAFFRGLSSKPAGVYIDRRSAIYRKFTLQTPTVVRDRSAISPIFVLEKWALLISNRDLNPMPTISINCG